MKGVNKLKLLKKLYTKNGIKLILYLVKNPIKTTLTYLATQKTLFICTKKFGSKHFHEGIENAYRHTLWSILVIKYVHKIYSFKHAIEWKYKFSELYENCFFSSQESKKMDEHNNQIGISWLNDYEEKYHKIPTEKEILSFLDTKLSHKKQPLNNKNEFYFIE